MARGQLWAGLLGQSNFSPPVHEGMEDAIVVWLPSIAITGMTFYTGDRFPHWKRNLFVGGLREGSVFATFVRHLTACSIS
jgi:glucose/arabinose dehydrogenase